MASSIQCVTGATRVLRLLSVASNLNKTNCCNAKKSINATIAFPLQAEGSTTTSKPLAFGFISNVPNFGHSTILTSRLITGSKTNYRHFSSLQKANSSYKSTMFTDQTMVPWNCRYLSSKEVTKNMTLFTNEPFKGEVDPKTLEIKEPSGNPLVLMMAWLMAKQKHLKKYAQIYTEMGFDVMIVHVTPWQLLWPVKGTQVVAADTLKFLDNNGSYTPIVVHGFSVGAYQLGEVMLQMSRNKERYAGILDRIVCQIWDSAADITEIPVGVPKSLFPKNPRMQSALRNYILYHMKTFHNQATIHYMRSSQMFHSTLIKQPALFFVSQNDSIGPPSSNHAVRENWERANIKCTFKCWEHSQHAAHFMRHREEYLGCLLKHLETSGAIDSIGLKTRAKL
ncbi:uncharacterized protein l(2)k09913 isoform X2 [Bactrocera oleae]|uniref:uncharacterized protein l(2)k09913 isoform X2 n=2 Tax=Bactrocera oleae TaxID=104688 RepID=UPI0006B6D108|nr:uncharacterized protein LOC106617530 isoform X2 [Bactrocera oleae]XP_036230122.1 uncharacterized protein LOC106617530 isoform X2 [Bactrocera oleae]XP_036230123.1 uncharacterized protein LOC106617530 isoform X2 [Bactrocera oleae]XP_036230124.1 uncharacterized protein LOC106617530 isoform X2 [Bactrocera oleae]XP_036230125.1 uncharacterized protein LOC106617530 isoform X2 [Bactrocera oleae]XP_036230126.1 uncharacterized protein LOC106617530 isoform X2 [Bactrocera oleae]XP_036230127.1 uncharac